MGVLCQDYPIRHSDRTVTVSQRTAPTRASVPRARQSYLFGQSRATLPSAISPKSHVDASDDRSIPKGAMLMPPELDPDVEMLDPDDPDSWDSDPDDWPGWTDAHRYAPRRHAAGGGR